MKFIALITLSICIVFCSCKDQRSKPDVAPMTDSAWPAKTNMFFEKSGMDTTVKPGDNFYSYANGKWVKETIIPDDQSGWGGFYTLYENNLKKLKGIAEAAAAQGAASGSLEQKVGDYYAAGMDTVTIEKAGATPLQPMLAKIDAIQNNKDLTDFIADINTGWTAPLMGFSVGSDEKNSTKYIAIFTQAGLTLPEKDYYTRTDSASVNARRALVDYATALFRLTGNDTANAASILTLESIIAKSHRTPAETRDPQKNYNKTSLAQLQTTEPNIGWAHFFEAMGAKADSVNIQQPGYFAALNNLLVSQPIAVWKTKLKFDVLAGHASLLSKGFRDARFAFDKTFSGQKKESERWKKIIQRTDAGLGELLGQLYVKKYFTEKAKQRMDELVTNLQRAFETRISKLDWMTDTTKTRATQKLNAFMKKIGYPTKWKNYDDVTINRKDFFASAKSIQKHDRQKSIKRIGTPVERTEWDMSPPTVNAYYNPSNNEIVFPAGILQFPFFDENADDAINYGGIGMVIGHEMTHAFDDQGSQYDLEGNMKNWWNSADNVKFKSKTAGVVKQYNSFTLFGDMHVNGSLTLGENLADIGGIAIAYDAFKLTKQGQGNELIDGFTPDQRFFLSFAQIWRSKYRPEIQRMYMNVDPHSPDIFRVNGTLSNFDPFYSTFNVQPGDSMYLKPELRARIW